MKNKVLIVIITTIVISLSMQLKAAAPRTYYNSIHFTIVEHGDVDLSTANMTISLIGTTYPFYEPGSEFMTRSASDDPEWHNVRFISGIISVTISGQHAWGTAEVGFQKDATESYDQNIYVTIHVYESVPNNPVPG